MPPQSIDSGSAPQHIDFGSNLRNFIISDDDEVHDHAPGALLDGSDFEYEDFSDPEKTRSKARVIADSALADLERVTSEADTERLRRRPLRKHRATKRKKLRPALAKGQEKSFEPGLADLRREIVEEDRLRSQALSEHPVAKGKKLDPAVARGDINTTSSDTSSHAVAAQNNVAGVSTNKVRHPLMKQSLNLGGPPSSSGTTVLAQSDVSAVASIKSRLSPIDPSLKPCEQKPGRARPHDRGFLSLTDDLNARSGAHTAATRRLADRGLFSEDQLATAAARAKLRADARADNAEVTPEIRLAAARARLATKGRVVPTVSQRASDSGVKAPKLASPAPSRPESSQVPATLGAFKLSTELKAKILFPAGTAQLDLSTADGVKQPVSNTSALRQLLANEPKREVEAGRRCTGYPVLRALPIYGPRQVSKSSSAKSATAPVSTTTTPPSQPVRGRTFDTAVYAAILADPTAKEDAPTPAEVLTHKLDQDSDYIDFDAGKKHSTKLTAATKTIVTTPSQSVSKKVQAILRRHGNAMNICDDASFVAHKFKEDADRIKLDAGKTPSTPAQLNTSATLKAKSTHVLTTRSDVTKTAEIDDGFDVLTSKGPSAANGSPLPDPDSSLKQLNVEFSPTLKGFQGWEDDYDSDDSEEWDLGGLAE